MAKSPFIASVVCCAHSAMEITHTGLLFEAIIRIQNAKKNDRKAPSIWEAPVARKVLYLCAAVSVPQDR